jgi:hypothetical protein
MNRAQIAYEEDVRRWPLYDDGAPRPTWARLREIAKLSWQRNPTPRSWPSRA